MDLAGRGFNLVLLGKDGGENRARMLAREAGEQRDPYRYMGPERAYVGTGQRTWWFFLRNWTLLPHAFLGSLLSNGAKR